MTRWRSGNGDPRVPPSRKINELPAIGHFFDFSAPDVPTQLDHFANQAPDRFVCLESNVPLPTEQCSAFNCVFFSLSLPVSTGFLFTDHRVCGFIRQGKARRTLFRRRDWLPSFLYLWQRLGMRWLAEWSTPPLEFNQISWQQEFVFMGCMVRGMGWSILFECVSFILVLYLFFIRWLFKSWMYWRHHFCLRLFCLSMFFMLFGEGKRFCFSV